VIVFSENCSSCCGSIYATNIVGVVGFFSISSRIRVGITSVSRIKAEDRNGGKMA
jgi:tRNA(Arg) A34 adenosine deaminase TadA